MADQPVPVDIFRVAVGREAGHIFGGVSVWGESVAVPKLDE